MNCLNARFVKNVSIFFSLSFRQDTPFKNETNIPRLHLTIHHRTLPLNTTRPNKSTNLPSIPPQLNANYRQDFILLLTLQAKKSQWLKSVRKQKPFFFLYKFFSYLNGMKLGKIKNILCELKEKYMRGCAHIHVCIYVCMWLCKKPGGFRSILKCAQLKKDIYRHTHTCICIYRYLSIFISTTISVRTYL